MSQILTVDEAKGKICGLKMQTSSVLDFLKLALLMELASYTRGIVM